jgi:hypothetical protein
VITFALALSFGLALLPPDAGGQGADEGAAPAAPAASTGLDASQFSHKVHIQAVGGQCVLCHEPRGGGKFYLTDTDVCARCHELPPEQMDEFRADMEKFVQPRIVGPFHHDRHREKSTERGMPADRCIDCHAGMDQSTRSSEPNVPTMEGCYTCHTQFGSESVSGKAGTECSLCHVPGDFGDEKFSALQEALARGLSQEELDRVLVPASHLAYMPAVPGSSIAENEDWIPKDHTEFFRTSSHGRKSLAPNAKCYSCHQEQGCSSCHQSERPRSHTPRFIRSTHGRYALMDRQKCASCHQADSCASCHDVPPRNHSVAFMNGDHSLAARVELRSCFQCHVFDIDCVQCHNR